MPIREIIEKIFACLAVVSLMTAFPVIYYFQSPIMFFISLYCAGIMLIMLILD